MLLYVEFYLFFVILMKMKNTILHPAVSRRCSSTDVLCVGAGEPMDRVKIFKNITGSLFCVCVFMAMKQTH